MQRHCHPRRRLARAALVAVLLASSAGLAHAGAVDLLPPAPSAPVAYPGAEPGAMRSWVQLVWNPVTRRLDRLGFTAFDPIASLGLELGWQPDDPADGRAGPLTGRGTLSFRKPGAPAYDPGAIVAQYRGELVDGRAEGQGEFLDSAGFAYAGHWRNGLMDGLGRLTLPSGDEYVGAFRAGRRDGPGTYTDATGAIYDGRFAADHRDGPGIVYPAAGAPYAADFSMDSERPGTRHAVPADALPPVRLLRADYPAYDDLRLSVVAERRPHNYKLGLDPLAYTARAEGQGLVIEPDDRRLLDVWHGTAPLTMTPEEIIAFDSPSTTPSFLGAFERFDPLALVFGLENASTAQVSVVGGFLDISTSDRDPEPAVQVRPIPRDPCVGDTEFSPKFYIDNFGWAAAENATIAVSAGAVDGRLEGTPLSLSLGSISGTSAVDLSDQFAGLGIDSARLATERLRCKRPNDAKPCLAELRKTGYFGRLADYIALDYSTVIVAASGTLAYDWQDAAGTSHHKVSPFSVNLPIASVASDAECGEGGEIVPVRHDPFQFRLGEQQYRIAIPFAGDIDPGFTSRWRIELSAPETSAHDFRIVLALADGRQVASRPIHLTYFMPARHVVPR